ncbi:BTAD domain-containing putative transcriptional regulator [Kibdelosporangium aridum]|uniref:Predicted ATPase n=1 Tax=Kibdelosporangium aridum TaxID=2030 RepID=A0A1W2FME8_KIBAR|nr:BTAD domain-containing putative transcriptional regulator [Kibdelosporangium aridum]SMD22778.1 Predicted ATPase [Kibdelosporangium aridum]
MFECRLLGSVEVRVDGRLVDIGPPRQRCVFAVLAVEANTAVSVDQLIDRVWADHPPLRVRSSLHSYLTRLRRALRSTGMRIIQRSGTYVLAVNEQAIDLHRFRDLISQARAEADDELAFVLAEQALELWRGEPFAGLDTPWLVGVRTGLERERATARLDHIDVALRCGQHARLLPTLSTLADENPLDERLAGQLMLAFYRTGRQADALAHYQYTRQRLAEELGTDPCPDLQQLHRHILAADPSLTLVAATGARARGQPPLAQRPRTNLRPALTELIGRDGMVAELRSLLRTARLVTLTGPGGVGKTRLALEAASQLVDELADGVWLVELAAVDRTGGPGVAGEVLAVLGIHDTDPGPMLDKLAVVLSTRQVLLVLDNCEHLIESVAELAEKLLLAAPDLRILTTSREPLGIPGEVVWGVPALDVPDPADTSDLDRYGAVRLFVARAAAAAHGFALDAGNRAAVAQLCIRLDGIPLALELAATRVRTVGVHGLVERLDDRFRLPAVDHRGTPARHRTLATVIDWSWQLLTEPEKAVLRRLAAHSGGSTMDAAEATCFAADVPAADVMDLVTRLVDRSLVVMVDQPGGPRFRLLESIAAYGVERLREAGELDEVRARVAEYYADLAVQADSSLRGPEQQQWLRRLDAESPNMYACLNIAISTGAVDCALRMVNALTWYWFLRGRLADARRSLAATLAVVPPASGNTTAEHSARAYTAHAAITLLQGDSAGWAARRQAVLDRCDGIADTDTKARAQYFLALAEAEVGNVDGAERLLAQTLDAFDKTGNRWGTAAALATRAKLAHTRADTTALERDGTRSAELFRTLGDRWGLLQATEWLGGLAEMTGDHERATRLYQDGLHLAEEFELWPAVARHLSWLGWIALELGDHIRARELCEKAMHLAIQQDSQPNMVFAELGLGFSARRAGKLDIAETHLHNLIESATRQTDGPHAMHVAMVLVELGLIAESRGDPETALGLHLKAFDVAHQRGDIRDLAFATDGLAGALAMTGRHVDAARLLGAAAACRLTLGLPLALDEREDVNRITAAVRAALGPDQFAAEFHHGHQAGAVSLRATLPPTGRLRPT